jgi:hypothetical protein
MFRQDARGRTLQEDDLKSGMVRTRTEGTTSIMLQLYNTHDTQVLLLDLEKSDRRSSKAGS